MAKTRNDEIYEAGVKAGKEGNIFGEFVHNNFVKGSGFTEEARREQEIFDKGYTFGAEHRNDRLEQKVSGGDYPAPSNDEPDSSYGEGKSSSNAPGCSVLAGIIGTVVLVSSIVVGGKIAEHYNIEQHGGQVDIYNQQLYNQVLITADMNGNKNGIVERSEAIEVYTTLRVGCYNPGPNCKRDPLLVKLLQEQPLNTLSIEQMQKYLKMQKK